ncbi:hypothetical protein CSW49_11810 [Thermus scotoductus]|uniref:Uncharacterized protein n=1 Tax=Thermus scotoductus TaxID=37636 RepID=A0A430QZJ1_THESC|nr:hypothetical protein CSW49_11810 [Thermus scotoductus]RTH00559.1 hypothetical protein CSW45_13290 [Thermus scotoductus]RTH16173.1 hypothetical protein CSW42_13550 [Thermus scotoductus]
MLSVWKHSTPSFFTSQGLGSSSTRRNLNLAREIRISLVGMQAACVEIYAPVDRDASAAYPPIPEQGVLALGGNNFYPHLGYGRVPCLLKGAGAFYAVLFSGYEGCDGTRVAVTAHGTSFSEVRVYSQIGQGVVDPSLGPLAGYGLLGQVAARGKVGLSEVAHPQSHHQHGHHGHEDANQRNPFFRHFLTSYLIRFGVSTSTSLSATGLPSPPAEEGRSS